VRIDLSIRFLAALLGTLLLAACASSVIVPEGVEVAPVGPAHVLERGGHDGQTVVWGGQIVEVENLADRTLLVVASYPLDRSDRPRWQEAPGVRFIAERSGFLEPLTFAPGRFVTVLGTVDGTEQRPVGEFDYRHPKLNAEALHLWPADPYFWDPQVRWNLGIGVHL
jgi:outer membrane lipoprotein